MSFPSAALLVFCNDLEAGVLKAGTGEVRATAELGAVYRADTLFEALADLSASLVANEQGRMGPPVVRTEALKVCRLAVLLWLSVCAGEDGEDGRG